VLGPIYDWGQYPLTPVPDGLGGDDASLGMVLDQSVVCPNDDGTEDVHRYQDVAAAIVVESGEKLVKSAGISVATGLLEDAASSC